LTKKLSWFNIIIISTMGFTYLLRVSTYLTIDQIIIISLLKPVCHNKIAYIIWVIEKGFVVPLKDIFDIALISYLVVYQTK